jgi:plastocyanin
LGVVLRAVFGLTVVLMATGCPEETAAVADMTATPHDLPVVADLSSGDLTPALTASVSVNDNFYAPRDVVIARGGTVTWTWRGATAHTVSSDDGSTFSSPEQTTGTFVKTFASAGRFPYHCEVHGSSMSGSVTVR